MTTALPKTSKDSLIRRCNEIHRLLDKMDAELVFQSQPTAAGTPVLTVKIDPVRKMIAQVQMVADGTVEIT